MWGVRPLRTACTLVALLLVSAATSGCVGRHALAIRNTDGLGPAISWFAPKDARDAGMLDNWRRSVGPPIFTAASGGPPAPSGTLTLVSWNTALGAGDVERLVADVRRQAADGPIVLLLQEVYRGGPEVPTVLGRRDAFASRLSGLRSDGRRDEVESIASALGMSAYYVPSMRNGSPLLSDEDRGNAILSTLPLSDLTAIELPLESQRRVALQATVTVTAPGGASMPLRVVDTHFTNTVLHHLFILSESGRLRQARALARVLPADGPLIVGGDFNSWFGYRDAAFKELARVVPPASSDDRRATFGPMRLDHVLLKLPDGWRASVRRAAGRYGSDHYPLVAVIEAK